MTSTVCEYLWTDAKGKLRSKVRVITDTFELDQLPPEWNYDGSSTGQASTENSEVYLNPVKKYIHPFNTEWFLILCETSWENDPRVRANKIFSKDQELQMEPMFGFEQEFFMFDSKTNKPIGWEQDQKEHQEDYYCGIGHKNVNNARIFMDDVLSRSINIGLNVNGYNFEVAIGQGEFQVCAIGIDAGDQLLMLRYIAQRTGELHGINIIYDAKPLGPGWNGSGMHTNFSTKQMRNSDDEQLLISGIEKLGKHHDKAMKLYGNDNHLRLTGIHETSSMDKFSYGVANRAASVRIPSKTKKYFEDRRPSAVANGYDITAHIYECVCLS